MLLFTALIDVTDDLDIGFLNLHSLDLNGHIVICAITILLLLLTGYIVGCRLEKIEHQYESILKKDQYPFESEANLAAILNNTNTSYYLMSTEFKIIDFNQLSLQLVLEETGKRLQKGTSYLDYIRPERQAYFSSLYKKTMAGEEINTEIKTRMGRWYRVHMKRIVGQNNVVLGLCIASTDIAEIKKVQHELKDSEELYRLIFHNGPSPKWIVDQRTLQCLEVNEQAILDYGYSREEFLKMTVYDIRKPDTHRQIKEMLAGGTYGTMKNKIVHHVKKNGETMIVQISLYPVQFKGTEAFMALAHDVTELLQLQDQLIGEKVNKQIEITKATIKGQEKERAELGKELHDNINQLLTSAKLYLESSMVEEQKRIAFTRKGIDLVLTGINEIRKISKSLAPPSLGESSLKEALADLMLPAKATGMNVYLHLNGIQEDLLRDELKIGLYRIAQEAFNNAIKYAAATQIYVSLVAENDLLILKIKDNGKGFDPGKKRNGIGITNMCNRTAVLNGHIEINAAPAKGCTIKAAFKTPLRKQN